MTLTELWKLCKPIIEREEAQRKRRIADFLKALKPNGYKGS